MSKKKKKGKKGNFLKRWNDWETVDRSGNKTKYHPGRAAAKTGVDLVGVTAGGLTGALGGIWTPFIGFALLAGGHLLGDKSGLLRIVGASMMAYGIAKAKQNHAESEANSVNGVNSLSGAKDRMIDFKDNFLKAFFLDKLTKKKDEDITGEGEQTMGAIDLSALDAFEDMTKKSAYNFEMQRAIDDGEADEFEDEDEFEEDFEDEDDFEDDEFEDEEFEDEDDELDGLNYTVIEDDDLDLATL